MQDILLFLQHHLLITAILAIVLVLLVILEFQKIRQGATQLSPVQATQLINHQNATVIDLRMQEAYAVGHITGALSIPYRELEKQFKKIEKFKLQPIILVCASGKESALAAITLQKNGFQQPQVLAGGISAWKTADMPLVKE